MLPVLSLLKQLLTAKELAHHAVIRLAQRNESRSHSHGKLGNLNSIFLCQQKMPKLMDHYNNGKYQ